MPRLVRSVRSRPRLCEILAGLAVAALGAAATVYVPELAPILPPEAKPSPGSAAAAAAAAAAFNALRVYLTGPPRYVRD